MKTWNAVALAASLAAGLAIASTAALATDRACPAQPEQVHRGRPHAGANGAMPQVRIQRRRCPAPAPVRKDQGCDGATQTPATNPPPPRGTEPAFGEVPVAAVVPPSAPYSGQVPPGPAQGPHPAKPGCAAHPAS